MKNTLAFLDYLVLAKSLGFVEPEGNRAFRTNAAKEWLEAQGYDLNELQQLKNDEFWQKQKEQIDLDYKKLDQEIENMQKFNLAGTFRSQANLFLKWAQKEYGIDSVKTNPYWNVPGSRYVTISDEDISITIRFSDHAAPSGRGGYAGPSDAGDSFYDKADFSCDQTTGNTWKDAQEFAKNRLTK